MLITRAATAVAAACGALLLLAAALVTAAPASRDLPGALATLAVGILISATAAVLGVVVARRGRGGPVGLLLALIGLVTSFVVAREVAWRALADRPGTARSLAGLVAALEQSVDWIFVLVALLLLYFPDGRLPGPRWRPVPFALVACAALDQFVVAFEPAPFRPPLQDLSTPFSPLPPAVQALGNVAFFGLLALVLACAASLLVRYRRSDPLPRKQIRWIAVAGLGVPLYPLMCLAEIALWGSPSWVSATVGVLSLAGIPGATAVAILRHDLYDVDKVLATAVTYTLVSASLVALYAGGSFVAGLLVGGSTPASAAAATALCAAALVPVRRRVQRAVDRRLYPLRRAALTAVESLHRDTRAGLARPEELQSVLRRALREPGLRVVYRVPGGDGFADGDGSPVDAAPDAPGAAAIVLDGTTIGALVDAPGLSAELLREVAAACATLTEVVRLRLELARVVQEVESSRARLLHAGYVERRRLERDLHDGAQQRLVSLGMALRLAQRHLQDGTVEVDGLLDEAVAELGTAVAELRQIAHGLRPSLLDDGLDAALRALARTVPLTVELEVSAPGLPDDVATTAYYIVSEAVANAVKHAAAQRVELHVTRRDDGVLVRVTDDGRGGAALAGSSLADRVAASGGRLRVASPAGRGTVVEAVLPCAS